MVDEEKHLKRIKQLIALAASTNENEARNASYLACKMIREHGFEVVGTRPRARGFGSRPDVNVNVAHVVSLDDVFETVFGSQRVAEARARSYSQDRARVAPEPEPIRKRSEQKKAKPPRMKNGAVLITAKHSGACRDCGSRIEQGDMVWWKLGVGCVHGDCEPSVLT